MAPQEQTGDSHRKAVIGNANSPGAFWLYDSKTGFDLTHPETPSTPIVDTAVTLETRDLPIKIDPAKAALVIIDMQNYFLSPGLGRYPDSNGLRAQKQLIEKAIPAARRAEIRIVWLNWGLTQSEVDAMPPATVRDFGFKTIEAQQYDQMSEADFGSCFEVKPGRTEHSVINHQGLGGELGMVDMDGQKIDAGRALMRDQWNSDLTPELKRVFEEGKDHDPPDVWVHKDRMSAFWDRETLATEFLDSQGIRTLIFAGVNTDQCVGGSVQDAYYKGYDVILLSDGAATTSPDEAQKGIEYNCTFHWGFCMDCEQFLDGVNKSRV